MVAALAALLAPAASAHAAAYVPGEVLVEFEGQAGLRDAAVEEVNGRERDLDVRAVPNLELVKLPAGASVPAAVAELEALPGVKSVSPNFIAREEETIPNEPRFGSLWAARNVGQVVGGLTGVPDADIDLSEAWDVTRGSPGVVIAVMDGGIDHTHPDLAPNLWSNPADGPNGIDDDGNGLVDDSIGYDFTDDDADPRDLRFHGTHTAGIIGAAGNTGFGSAGINWSAKLMALRVTDAFGSGSSADIIQAMDYAGRHGVRVLNGSLGFKSNTLPQPMADVVAAYPNTLFVFAAGNDGTDSALANNDVAPHYPSSLPGDNVISVAASTNQDQRPTFSNYGPTSVDLAAPGQSTLSTGIAAQTRLLAEFTGPALSGFNVDPPWAAVTQSINDTSESVLADSPAGLYGPNANTAATSAAADLTGLSSCRLFFQEKHSLGTGDRVDVQAVVNGGAPVDLGPALTGTTPGPAFITRTYPLTVGEGSNSVRIRFRLVSDATGQGDGISLDDVTVRCFTPGQYIGPNFDGTSFSSGTSFAAPQVSGVAGLLLAKNPAVSTAQLRAAILGGVDPKPAFAGITVTGGRLNALNALNLTPAPPAPPPPPPPLLPDRTRPVVSYMAASPFAFQPADRGATLSRVIVIRPRRLPRFTTVSIRLSEAATVAFRVERLLPGRRVGRSCLLATRARRFRPRCTRAVLLPGTFRTALRAGLNRKRFNGRLLNRKLPVGSYRLVATATDAARNVSLQRRAGFRTLAAPRVRIIRR